MKKLFFMIAAAFTMFAAGAQTTDRFDGTTLTLTDVYEQQQYTGASTAEYLVTLKDDGNGPQFKAGSSAIVVTKPATSIVKITVKWGSKSNEDVAVYTQDFPYSTSSAAPSGEVIGTIDFTANGSSEITFDPAAGVQYVALTSTAKKGKACQFTGIEIEWAGGEVSTPDPIEGVIINEVCGDDGTTDGHEDWIELLNTTDHAIDISGAYLVKTDENGSSETLCTIAEGTVIQPDGLYVVEKGTDFTAGISNNKNVMITLYSPADARIDFFNKEKEFTHNGFHRAGESYSYFNIDVKEWRVSPASKGEHNIYRSEIELAYSKYSPVTSADQLHDGLQVALVNLEHMMAMTPSWDKTSDGGVYLYGRISFDADCINADGNITMPEGLAFVTLKDGGDGTWALKFGETGNYLNDSRYMACTAFKNIDFKKNDDPAKGTRATISFNAAGDAEINFGAEAGSLKFNYKGDNTSRFFNYDPADKPEDHLAVFLFTPAASTGIALPMADTDSASAPVYYNLQGVRVICPTPGIYLMQTAGTVKKVIVR